MKLHKNETELLLSEVMAWKQLFQSSYFEGLQENLVQQLQENLVI